MSYLTIIDNLRQKTDTVILFHSGTGKDSIMLAHLLSNKFKKVICVFMYLVKDLDYENNYIKWHLKRYPNIEFIQVPHYALPSFIRNGYLGIEKDPKFPKTTISKIDEKVRTKLGIDWTVYGFKKNDGITRRLMLKSIDNGINHKTQKAYPLMDLKNSDVLKYIKDHDLIEPFNYGTKKPSSGCDISTPEFQAYLRDNYPNDLNKIYKQFPLAQTILFKYDNYGKGED